MADTASLAPPPPPPYVVDQIRDLGNDLYQLRVVVPSGPALYFVMPLSALTFSDVVLAADVVATLHATRNGAEPALRPFR